MDETKDELSIKESAKASTLPGVNLYMQILP